MSENHPKIEAVIFDMDGLMFDTEDLFSEVQSRMARKRGKVFTRSIKEKMMGQKALDAIKIMLQELGIHESPEAVLKEQVIAYTEFLKIKSQPMKGLFELLDFLEGQKIRKGVATSSLKQWVDILFDEYDLASRFETVITGETVKKGKPDPEIYKKGIQKLDLNSSACLVLEDSLNGIRAAKRAGCVVAAIPNQFTRDQDFSEADLVVKRLNSRKLFDFITATASA
jgi:HAD superfamily hydrolase (TIGR01509 family)